MVRHREQGQGRVGFVVTLGLFLLGIFLAIKIVPARVDGYQFQEVLREEVRNAAVHHNDEKIAERIMDKAQSMDIPLERSNLKISRSQAEVVVTATYERQIDLQVTTYTYKFKGKQAAPLF